MKRMKQEIRLTGLDSNKTSILLHSLGLDENGNGKMFRNHYCPGIDDKETIDSLVAGGWMIRNTASYKVCGQTVVHVSDKGKYSICLAISIEKEYKNCINCACMQVINGSDPKTHRPVFVCSKARDLGKKEKALYIESMVKSRKCYQGFFNVK